MKTFLLMLCFALVLPACTAEKALIISGDSLIALKDQFVATAAAMDVAVDNKVITVEAYRKWKAFGLKFQAAYPLATNLWQVANNHKDDAMIAQASATVAALAADLGAYAALVGVK